MSTYALVQGLDGVIAAWETEGQIYFARIKAGSSEIAKPIAATGRGKNRKHPALAVNQRGEILLAWTEGTDWAQGGDLAWQVFDRRGTPMKEKGRVAGGIPVWGVPAVVSSNNEFTLIH